MTEPTIQELIDEVINCAYDFQLDICNYSDHIATKYAVDRERVSTSRSALLSRITQIQQESDEWHKTADKLNRYSHHHGDCSLRRNYRTCDCGLWVLQNELDALTQRYEKENIHESSILAKSDDLGKGE